MNYKNEYERWLKNAPDMKEELTAMDEAAREDAFYRELEFGTGGLRGVIGAGTNRMNVYTVARASAGLARYVNRHFPDCRKIAVAYDSRIMSDLFSRTSAAVFAAAGCEVYFYPELMPTPCLSFAVRYFGCAAGINITASHNPAKYNGYKVYGSDGCQITNKAADDILQEIQSLDVFAGIDRGDFDRAVEQGAIHFIGEDCVAAFLEEVKKQSVLYGDRVDRNVAIVYSPLNGAGLKPVTRVLRETGFTNISVVKEQEMPDGHFPTCPYPNPEIREALALGLRDAEEKQADLMLATDPDSDRVGIAVREKGAMKLLTGNEVGMLLVDFICSQRQKHGKMPENPLIVKTVVTTDMADRIAAHYGVKAINVLTGFKYIGDQIYELEKKGQEDRYLFGFEESYGYLSGSYVRDKDAVDAAFLICEMFAYYKTRGLGLAEKLEELYRTYGYALNTTHSFLFEGSAGFKRMGEIMDEFRKITGTMAGCKIVKFLDYAAGIDGLPKAAVLKYQLEDGSSVILRPSGTEPKMKLYLSAVAPSRAEAEAREAFLAEEIGKMIR